MKKIIYSAAILVIVMMGSCKRDYLDANENPNLAVSSTAELVLPTALNNTAGTSGNVAVGRQTRITNQIGSLWGGQWAITTSVSGFEDERDYRTSSAWGTSSAMWADTYDNLGDYNFVEKDATSRGLKNYAGIAQVMKVYNYQLLVDCYGNVPYSDALKGANGANATPKYDDAQTIYTDLVVKLDAAIANLSAPVSVTNIAVGSSDIYCKGDMNKWIRFANTLKLRILMRQSEMDQVRQDYVRAEIAKITNPLKGDVFLGYNDNMISNPGYLQTAGKQNPFWDFYGFTPANTAPGQKSFFGLSKYGLDLMEVNGGLRDFQRIMRVYTLASATPQTYTFKGIPFGTSTGEEFGSARVSQFGPGLLQKFNQDAVVMTASESLMLQAEANFLGFLTTGPSYKELFKDAVKSSFILLKAGNVPLVGAVSSGQTDVSGLTVDFAKLSAGFDASISQSVTAAEKYLDPSGPNAGSLADIDNAILPLNVIMGQKLLCLNGYGGFSTWCDVRKYQDVTAGGSPKAPALNIPKSVSLKVLAGSSLRPLRIPYPIEEVQVNGTSLNAAIAAQPGLTNGDILSKRLFWDVK